MSIKSLVRGAIVAALLALPVVGLGGGPVATTITITETVDTFAEWDSGTGTATLNVADHITDRAAHSGTITLHLYTNANTVNGTVQVKATPADDGTAANATGILKNSDQSVALDTMYMLTGAGLNAPDGSWLVAGSGASEFFNAGNAYILKNGVVANNDYAITLNVQAQAATGSSPPATPYTAAVTLTATW